MRDDHGSTSKRKWKLAGASRVRHEDREQCRDTVARATVERRGRDRLQPSRASTETAGPRTVIGRRSALEALATYDPAFLTADEDIRRRL